MPFGAIEKGCEMLIDNTVEKALLGLSGLVGLDHEEGLKKEPCLAAGMVMARICWAFCRPVVGLSLFESPCRWMKHKHLVLSLAGDGSGKLTLSAGVVAQALRRDNEPRRDNELGI